MNIQGSVVSLLNGIIDKVVNSEVNRKTNDAAVAFSETKPVLQSNSSGLERCRICYESGGKAGIFYPCRCKGTMGAVHLRCLERWLEESYSNSCELCGYQFQVVRTPRYNIFRSIWIWLHLDEEEYLAHVQSLRVDLIRCMVVTPLTIACTYMCLVATDFYAAKKYKNYVVPTLTWSSYSLLFFMTMLLLSYFIWIFMAIQYHERIWFEWWKKQSTVKVIIPNSRARSEKHLSLGQIFT